MRGNVFKGPEGWDLPLIALFVAMHGIILFNAICHEPGIGYDALEHLRYIESFSTYQLPTPAQTAEFFSPPLPYLLPATLRHYGVSLWGAAKSAQLFNVGYSLLLAWVLLMICEEMRPGERRLKWFALALLAMLPVYYRSFAFVRGEPLLAAMGVLVMHRTLRLARTDGATAGNALALGLALGLLVLSRQWGLLIVPPVVLFLIYQSWAGGGGMRLAGAAAAALSIGALLGGWFYLILLIDHGRITAFNRDDRVSFSLANQPAEFYFGTGGDALFAHPVRSAFPNQLFPMFYSDVWGDYWCYFDVYGRLRDPRRLISGPALTAAVTDPAANSTLETNLPGMSRYLGRVNLVSLPSSALLLAGMSLGAIYCFRLARSSAPRHVTGGALLFLAVLWTMAGYFWFMLVFLSHGKGEAIKGTYVLQIFPFVAILGAEQLVEIWQRHARAARALTFMLAVTAAHNLPVLFTRMTLR
ncbi:MAG TPA: hypothetical protein VFE84_02920 [Patescibacteria group bacterium]|nr:hypothetical protein [Patescibacteria group bacterium]